MGITQEQIRIALQTALLGEIYQDIRAIAFAYNNVTKSFLLRFYMSHKPTDEDYENISGVMTEFISNFKYSDFKKLKEECKYSTSSKSKLDPLDGFVYYRKEN